MEKNVMSFKVISTFVKIAERLNAMLLTNIWVVRLDYKTNVNK